MKEKYIKALEIADKLLTQIEGMVMSAGEPERILEAVNSVKSLVEYVIEADNTKVLIEEDLSEEAFKGEEKGGL